MQKPNIDQARLRLCKSAANSFFTDVTTGRQWFTSAYLNNRIVGYQILSLRQSNQRQAGPWDNINCAGLPMPLAKCANTVSIVMTRSSVVIAVVVSQTGLAPRAWQRYGPQMTVVAVMQPYFMPYAGYFRLFAAADLVAIFDCAQFPRRSWVHRNRLPDRNGETQWLTLPLQKAPIGTQINNLKFTENAPAEMARRMLKIPSLDNCSLDLLNTIQDTTPPVIDYLETTLSLTCHMLNLPFVTIRTSTLNIPPNLKGANRVMAIAETLDAKIYLNAQGGRNLYDAHAFEARGMSLRFLDDWQGSNWSLLHRLSCDPTSDIATEIRAQC